MRSDRRRLFQSTLLQEERHVSCSLLLEMWSISIHAPTRGATDEIIRNQFIEDISIHAPTRGATLSQPEQWSSQINFNPRSYKRSDAKTNVSTKLENIFQSTLLQEERPKRKNKVSGQFNFNPRSYKRSDSKNAQYSLCISAIIIA